MVFEDEAGFTEHPWISRVWGRPFRVPTASNHQRRSNVFGWVAPLEGRYGLMRAPRGNTQGFLILPARLRQRWRGKVLHVFVDRARWHRGPNYLAAHRQIQMEYLPPYQPGLNPQNESGGNCDTRGRTTVGSRTSIKLGGLSSKPPAAGQQKEFVVYVTFLKTFALAMR